MALIGLTIILYYVLFRIDRVLRGLHDLSPSFKRLTWPREED